MFIARIIVVVMLVLGLLGCSSLGINRPSVETAAIMDVGTTYIGLQHGGVELNPLGFAGTNIAKLYYLYWLRPEYDTATRAEMDRRLTSLFVGASVNNALQLIGGIPLALSAVIGVIIGISTYNSDLAPKVEPAR